MLHSNVVSKIMSTIPSRNRAYSLKEAIKMGNECLSLVLDARIHRDIPKEVFELKQLIVLSTPGIRIVSLDKNIIKLRQLRVLNMLGCGTIDFPLGIEKLPLEALFLSDGKWDEIQHWIFNLKELKSLTINNYELKYISKEINTLQHLTELNLKDNSIKKLNINLKELKKIDLSNNKIKAINDDFYLLQNLKEINFNKNSIHLIDSKIGLFTKLNYLNLSNNSIKKIPHEIFNCYLLSHLFINNNLLEKIPEKLFSTPLSTLDISNNNIKTIPESITDAKRLRELNISKNQIEYIPISIYHLQQLESLDFSKNPIKSFPLGILGCNNATTIKGMHLVLDTNIRKLIIPFIQAMKRDKIDFDHRERLWTSFINIKSTTNRKELIRLLNSNFRPFKKMAIEKLLQPISALRKEDIKHICLLGKYKERQTIIKEELRKNNSKTTKQFSMENTHIVLGTGRYNSSIHENWKGVFLNEETLLQTLDIGEAKVHKEFNLSTIENIKKLLSSKKENLELALRLLENHKLPDELITFIYFIMITHEEANPRLKARNILRKKDDKELLQFSKKDFNKEYLISDILNKKISSKINKKELTYLLFNNYKKGWKFIYDNYDKNILNKTKGHELNLSNANLLKIIPELKNIQNIKTLNLSHNKLIQIKTEDIQLIKQFNEINLSNNPLEYIAEELLQLDNLRILHLKGCNNFNIDILVKKASWITIFR